MDERRWSKAAAAALPSTFLGIGVQASAWHVGERLFLPTLGLGLAVLVVAAGCAIAGFRITERSHGTLHGQSLAIAAIVLSLTIVLPELALFVLFGGLVEHR